MGVLSWLKKPNASTAELAEQITAAEAELVRAQTAKDDAQEAFTLEGTDAAVRKLVKAEEELVIAGKYLARSKSYIVRLWSAMRMPESLSLRPTWQRLKRP